jgi:hypothetical protein
VAGGAAPVAADPAWVIVAPPDFAPAIETVLTLYDAVYDVMAGLDPRLAVTDTSKVSFTKDIWLSELADTMHGEGKAQYFVSRLQVLSSNKPQDAKARDEIFRALRKPRILGGPNPEPGNMPFLPAAVDDPDLKIPGAALPLTLYKRMELWAAGKFDADWSGAEPDPVPLDKLSEQDRPQALDRAALEACVDGPFFPESKPAELCFWRRLTKIEDNVGLVQIIITPNRQDAGRRQMACCTERLPHPQSNEQSPGRRRQRLADARLVEMRLLDDYDGQQAVSGPPDFLDRRHRARGGAGALARRHSTLFRSSGWTRPAFPKFESYHAALSSL